MQKLDARTIIVNLLNEDKKTYTSVKRLQKLMAFIYDELTEEGILTEYQTYFNINFDAIERTVLYNNNIFKLDIDGEILSLRKTTSAEELAMTYKADENIKRIIVKFVNTYAA